MHDGGWGRLGGSNVLMVLEMLVLLMSAVQRRSGDGMSCCHLAGALGIITCRNGYGCTRRDSVGPKATA
jgi:hypothetical protein